MKGKVKGREGKEGREPSKQGREHPNKVESKVENEKKSRENKEGREMEMKFY